MLDHVRQRHNEISKSITSSIGGNSVSTEDLEKSANDYFEKGGKKAVIGETRTFGGREYIKTASGWKFHGKGTGAKAQEHKTAALGHHVDAAKTIGETSSGKKIIAGKMADHSDHEDWSAKDHADAAHEHAKMGDSKATESHTNAFKEKLTQGTSKVGSQEHYKKWADKQGLDSNQKVNADKYVDNYNLSRETVEKLISKEKSSTSGAGAKDAGEAKVKKASEKLEKRLLENIPYIFKDSGVGGNIPWRDTIQVEKEFGELKQGDTFEVGSHEFLVTGRTEDDNGRMELDVVKKSVQKKTGANNVLQNEEDKFAGIKNDSKLTDEQKKKLIDEYDKPTKPYLSLKDTSSSKLNSDDNIAIHENAAEIAEHSGLSLSEFKSLHPKTKMELLTKMKVGQHQKKMEGDKKKVELTKEEIVNDLNSKLKLKYPKVQHEELSNGGDRWYHQDQNGEFSGSIQPHNGGYFIQVTSKEVVKSTSLDDPKARYGTTSARSVQNKKREKKELVNSLEEAYRIFDKFINK